MQWNELSGLILALTLYLLPLAFIVIVVWAGRRIHYRRDRRSPISKDLLRGPGYSVAKELDDARTDLSAYMVAVAPMPLFLFSSWAAQSLFVGQLPHSFPVTYVLLVVAAAIYLSFTIIALVKRIRDLRLGFEAETAAGQELNQLLRDGFDVFHDVPGDARFNIDHVVVGPAGVFAIETKGRSKPIRRGKAEYKVQLDGAQLVFPTWVETEPLVQAKRNADWLGRWLSSATGEPVVVKPVLILPGWWVDRKTPSEVAVLSAGSCRQVIQKLSAKPISDPQLRRIAHQLDARCRDVAPLLHS